MSASLEKEGEQSSRSQKASKVLEELGVKCHCFVPSQREIWTVVGSEGDFLVEYDPEGRIQPFCSCDDFHFRVLGGSIAECYHLIATRKAKETNRFSTITFSDEEFKPFLRALIDDVFANIK